MRKIQKALKLTSEVYDDIDKKTKKDGFNFSEWVEIAYIKAFMTENSIKSQIAFNEKQHKNLLNKLEYLKRKREKKLNNLKKCDSTVLKQNTEFSKKVLRKNPEKIDARLRSFNKECKTDLTKAEFVELLGL